MNRVLRPLLGALAFALPVNAIRGEVTATFMLNIGGDDQAAFRAVCRLGADHEGDEIVLEGRPPLSKSFQGDSLSCSILQTGDGVLTVEVRSSSGNISRLSTTGHVLIRVD